MGREGTRKNDTGSSNNYGEAEAGRAILQVDSDETHVIKWQT